MASSDCTFLTWSLFMGIGFLSTQLAPTKWRGIGRKERIHMDFLYCFAKKIIFLLVLEPPNFFEE
jgi:hypothetical protein